MEQKRELPSARELPYWKTGASSPESWLGKIRRIIHHWDGQVIREGFIDDRGQGCFMLEFLLDGDRFRIVWPVCPSTDSSAARRQAATMLYHDVKARVLSAQVLGARRAFLDYWMLPGTQKTAGDVALEFPPDAIPRLLAPDG